MNGEIGVLTDELGKMPAEIADAATVGWVGRDVGLRELGEAGVAEIGVQHRIILAQHLGEACDVSVAINFEEDCPVLIGAVLDLGEDRVIAGEDAALKALL